MAINLTEWTANKLKGLREKFAPAVSNAFNNTPGMQAVRGVQNYFQPTQDVRARDIVRELPGAALETGKSAVRDIARFGISLAEIPEINKSGFQATGKWYNTPVGRINSFQSEVKNRINRGDPMWKALGNPAIEAVLAGSDVGALGNAALKGAKGLKILPAELRNIASDWTQPTMKTVKMPGIRTTNFVPTDNFAPGGIRQMRELPTPIKKNVSVKVRVPNDFKSKTMQSLQRPGMTIKDVSNKSQTPLQETALKAGKDARTVSPKLGDTGTELPKVLSPEKSSFTSGVPPTSGISKIGAIQPEESAPIINKAQNYMRDLYTKAINRFQPLESLAKTAGKETEMRNALVGHYGAGSTATYHVDYELKPVFKGVKADDLRAYTIAQRDIELAGREIKGSSAEAGQKVLAELQQKYGEGFTKLQESAQKLYQYQDNLVNEYLVKTGVISPENYAAMRAKNQAYIPFKRVMDTVDDYLGVSKAVGSVGSQNVIKGIQGSDRQIVDPLESIVENTYKIVSLGKRQEVARTIASLEKQLPGIITKAKEAGTETISLFQNGKKAHFNVPIEVAEAAKGLNEESLNTIVKILAAPTRVFRATATGVNPEFFLSNIARDVQSAFINAGVNPVDWVRGFSHYIKGDEVYQQFLKSGGLTSRIAIDKPAIQRTVKEITGTVADNPKKLLDLFDPRTIYKGLEKLGQASEQPTRIAAFGRTLRKGGTLQDAAYQAQEATTNFARRGSATKSVNALYAFMNARAQGTDRLVRTAIKQPGTTATRLGIITMAPALATYAYNRQFPEYFDERVVSKYDKENNFIVMAPWLGKDRFIKVPKGDVGKLANPLEAFLSYADGKGGNIAGAIGQALVAFLPGNNAGDIIPTALRPPVEAALNKNFFTGYDIVPDYKKDFPKPKQDNASTAPIYRLAGRVTNQSPAQIQNLTQGYLTGFARIGEAALNPAVPSQYVNKKNLQGDVVNRIPVVRRFIGGEKKTEEEQMIADEKKQQSQVFDINDIKSGVKRGDLTPEEGQAAIDKIIGNTPQKTSKPPILTDQAKAADEGTYELAGRLYSKTPGVDSVDLEKLKAVVALPSETNYQREIKEDEAWKMASQLEKFPASVKKQYLEQLGIDPDQNDYYQIAKKDNEIKAGYVADILDKTEPNQVMEELTKLRQKVNGEQILASGIITELKDAGVITKEQASTLNKITDYDPKTKTSKIKAGTGGKKKLRAAKKITFAKLKVSTPKKTTFKKLKAPSVKGIIKPVKRQKLSALPKTQTIQQIRSKLMAKR